ncbi:TIGR00730 family Rossman fold protein [Xanthobacter sp. V4C-4]|uniref:LOG family protein n=1 Tax=Xanthobacter cornucopiae TaxID=3119924 RepID=UPI00372CAE6B
MARIDSICVYCGSSRGADPVFTDGARRFGQMLAGEGIRLVYGGGGVGLMGEVATAAALGGGAVTGIIPTFLVKAERAFRHQAEMIEVADMHERKRLMFEQADAFVALPGGIGTLEELVEQITWAQLGQHRKPILLANFKGFWDPFLALIAHMGNAGFLPRDLPMTILTATRVEDILPTLRAAAAAIPDRDVHDRDADIARRM